MSRAMRVGQQLLDLLANGVCMLQISILEINYRGLTLTGASIGIPLIRVVYAI